LLCGLPFVEWKRHPFTNDSSARLVFRFHNQSLFDCSDTSKPNLSRAEVRDFPTVGWKPGRASRAISDPGRAYRTFQADRLLRQWRSAHAMNSPKTSRLLQPWRPKRRLGRRVAGPSAFSLARQYREARHKNSRWTDRCCYKGNISAAGAARTCRPVMAGPYCTTLA
jgi:hypothetical protein